MCVNAKNNNGVLSSWSDSVNASRYFVVTTPEKLFHFIAETENEQK